MFCTVTENGSGAYFFAVMCKERGDPQSSYGLAALKIYVFVVIINIPDDIAVRNKVNFTVI